MSPPAFAYCAQPVAAEWLALVAGLSARPGFWWLDSALAQPPLGRFSFAGAEPRCIARERTDALAMIRALLPPPGAELACASEGAAALPFVGGAVVAIGYELGAAWEGVPAAAQDAALPFAGATALGVDRSFAFDHIAGRGYAVALCAGDSARAAADAARTAARELAAHAPRGVWPPPAAGSRAQAAARVRESRRGFDAQEHAKAVEQIRERIAAGDLYQACLTHRIELDAALDPLAYYGALRAANPAPFGAYLALPEGAIACSSPERFLRCDANGWLETRPIKGTRPRRAQLAADRAELAALRESEKDRAENLMIVDLARNDLGRVAELGSVHVPELFAVESYATVHQLVSTVRAKLAPGRSALDALRAAFPPGSMTGAPKRAAMQLLARLERSRRGLYSGALGYFDARGGCDLAVTIRTAFLTAGRLALHTGGGIVADSDPGAEWEEAETKAAALLAVAHGAVPLPPPTRRAR